MASLIGALRVSLSADTAAFQKGMKGAERQAKSSASSIQKSLGLVKSGLTGLVSGLSVGLFLQAAKAGLEYAGSLGEIAQQLGVTTKELQTFRFAVEQNGGTAEDADKSLGKLSLTISKAVSGSKTAVAAFESVGVKLQDLRTLGKTEILGKIADNMKATGGASANAAAGVAIFGKGFQKIVPVLDLGSAGFNKLAAAAEELGIVLSDEQIQKADATADKLDALQTVLKAQIAGAVADNSDSIIQLADSLVYLVDKIADAMRWWNDFTNSLDAQAFDLASRNPFLSPEKRAEGARRAAVSRGKISDNGISNGVGGSSVTVTLAPAKRKTSSAPSGGAPNQFLGGGGGGRKTRASRDTSLRDAFQFDQEQRRAEMDILRAKQDLAHDYVERTALSIQMLDLEKEGYEAELQYRIAAKELTKPQADILRAKFESADHLQRMAVLEKEEEDRQRDYNGLEEKDFEIRMGRLQRESDLAETAEERRAVELKILDLAYEEERRRLQRIIDESKDWAEIEAARRDMLALAKNQSLDRQGVLNRTRGPMEDYLASLPTTAAKANEALERLQVDGLEGLLDSAIALTEGLDAGAESLLQTLKNFLLGVARLELQKLMGNALQAGGGIGGLFKSALGFLGLGGSGISGAGLSDAGISVLDQGSLVPSSVDLSGLAEIPQFDVGGFTGSIGRHRIAGFVHGEEGVLNARGMRLLGVPNLNALNRGAPLAAVAGGISNDNGLRGRGTVNQYFDVKTNDADSFRRSEGQILRDSRRKLGAA